MTYPDKLRLGAKETGNILCMGLDPLLSVLPDSAMGARERLNDYFSSVFRRMRIEGLYPAAFKPNIGYWAVLDRPRDEDFSGSLALADTLEMIDEFFPYSAVILDSKRGDIARSSENYASEAFDSWGADAVTVSPYMGSDSVFPFCREGKGIYVLDRTSNPGSTDLQSLVTVDRVDEKELYPLHMAVCHLISAWSGRAPGMGAVVGATSPEELRDISESFAGKEIPMLIPGVGSQGGSASEVMRTLRDAGYELPLARINSSSGITHPWKKGSAPDDYIERIMSALRGFIEESTL